MSWWDELLDALLPDPFSHFDKLLHAAGGAAITALGLWVGLPGALLLVVTTIFGVAREISQHDIRLTLHQWAEGLAWGLGSALMWVLYLW